MFFVLCYVVSSSVAFFVCFLPWLIWCYQFVYLRETPILIAVSRQYCELTLSADTYNYSYKYRPAVISVGRQFHAASCIMRTGSTNQISYGSFPITVKALTLHF